MRLDEQQSRARFARSPVARLATVTPTGEPHLVPIVFAVVDDVLYSSVDAKPKTTTALRRLANIAANPSVSVLVDHYTDDWTRLWWVRADGTARIAEPEEDRIARQELTIRYPIYRDQPPPGPVLAIDITRWTGWSAS
ncbi:TIGR03668 family PPOX class F420-dependent oxidoreductase [Nocardia callitridis]|uniref:TIGR03668 family PPOX class F420-dependent oxidoreductase n=1 Tax=Nocardia callitridis TaxID=648753 RepID=A0ABP9JT61_9NOCA